MGQTCAEATEFTASAATGAVDTPPWERSRRLDATANTLNKCWKTAVYWGAVDIDLRFRRNSIGLAGGSAVFLITNFSEENGAMKAVILAGGFGTRLSEETTVKPKPMVEVGGRPILWHIMKLYSAHGVHEFVICCGYKGYMIKEYFANYFLHMSDVTFDIAYNSMTVHERKAEPWRVTLVDTGDNTQTGGRLKRVADHVRNEEAFCFTYGDGLSDVNIRELIEFHGRHGKLATVTAVAPPGRYGALDIVGGVVTAFSEKPRGDGALINGGFFVLSPKVLDFIAGDATSFEASPVNDLAAGGHLAAFEHRGFWQAMDTLRDRNLLEELWESGRAPWKAW